MTTEIHASLTELKSIAQELFNLRKKTKELNLRKKELEVAVMDYLEVNKKPGLKIDNIMFIATEKTSRSRKKVADVAMDGISVLRKYGVQGDPNEVLKELEASRKGIQSSVPVLKMKAAGIFN